MRNPSQVRHHPLLDHDSHHVIDSGVDLRARYLLCSGHARLNHGANESSECLALDMFDL